MSADVLERRYLRLLRWYPPAYRRTRGSEILDTLMEAAEPGRRRPAGHERRALILGGLRVRTGADRQRSRAEVWLDGLRLGALVLLAHAAAGALIDTGRALGNPAAGPMPAFWWAGPVTMLLASAAVVLLAAGALVLLAAGRPVPALVVTVAAVVAQQAWAYGTLQSPADGLPLNDLMSARVWQLPLAAALLALLARRRTPPAPRFPATERPSAAGRPWRWLAAVPVGVLVLLAVPNSANFPSVGVLILLLVCGSAWSAVDARLPIALSAVLFAYIIPEVIAAALQLLGGLLVPAFTIPLTSRPASPVTFYLVVEVVLGALLLAVAARRAARQASA